MTAPLNLVSADGQGVGPADLLNTFLQGSLNVAALRAFTGVTGMTVWMAGTVSSGHGGTVTSGSACAGDLAPTIGTATLNQNYVDTTGAFHFFTTDTPIPPGSTFSGNINLVSGATITGWNTNSP